MRIKSKHRVTQEVIVFSASIMLFFGIWSPVQAAASCPPTLTQNLKYGETNPQVQSLQQILNMSADTRVALTGPGSPGQESTYFGSLTMAAVIRFQDTYSEDVLIPNGLTRGTGYVGPSTRTELTRVCAAAVLSSNSPAPAQTSPAITPPINPPQTPSSPPVSPVISTPAAAAQSPSQAAQSNGIQWGAYVGDGSGALSSFESLVGQKTDLVATFEGWDNSFPSNLSNSVGGQGKTLVVFWEPDFGYDTIISGTEDDYINTFAKAAKAYGSPVILVPFDEMNLNEQAWGYGQNGNTAAKFKTAWQHIHDLFASAGASNVKFGIAYNNVSVPDSPDNSFDAYYPGSAYVDYVGVDGFNFGNPWQTFDQVFDPAIHSLETYNKPIYIFSMGSTEGSQKAAWITEGLGSHVDTYANIAGWIWFNQNDASVPSSGDTVDWTINSDPAALQAFQAVISAH